MGAITENLALVRARAAEAALRAGLDPAEITLVAAAKTQQAAAVREAIAAGADAVGENRASELTEKYGQGAYEGAPLHFIGHLQTNKVRLVVGRAALIQSADSAALLEAIEKRASALGLVQAVLVQVNIGREAAKGGFPPEAAQEAVAMAGAYAHLRVEGLMAIPPVYTPGMTALETKNYPYFEEMRQLFVDITDKKYDNVHMRYLSMGMSGDYTEAIGSGANMVRVGSAIFGSRAPGKL